MSFFITIAIKLALGLVSLVFVINVTGKGNLAPSSAVDQVQNFVLGGIIGGVIYNSSISILQYVVILIIWTILILLLKWLNTNVSMIKHLIDGKPVIIIKNGKLVASGNTGDIKGNESLEAFFMEVQGNE